MSGPRVLAIMGSGETAPTMAKVHRALLDRFTEVPVPGAIIDTPYGFQENADDLSARTLEFFATNVGNPVEVASCRRRDADPVTVATAVARVRAARYVMAGPGSPSYALRHWIGGPIPDAMADKLANGGVITMASAAALTLGIATIPVYEIYKVGADAHWLEGLDLLGAATGLRAAVVPHYDNAEGGNHDTRFCYMGEGRLRLLEASLPDDAFILGVDGHTALVIDLERGDATVHGLGGVTVRSGGRSTRFGAGSSVSIAAIAAAARELAAGHDDVAVREGTAPGVRGGDGPRTAAPLRDEMADLEGAFIAALDHEDIRGAVAALLDLDSAITRRVRSGEDSPDLDSASATFRALIVRLGERAVGGTGRDGIATRPLADELVVLRDAARRAHDWSTADRIRDALAAAGVEVRDGPEGSRWVPAAGGDPS